MFESLPSFPADPLLSLISAFAADARPGKIDLGVGVYKDPSGDTPVMQAVKLAERWLVDQQRTKTYLGITGSIDFQRNLTKQLVRGDLAASLASKLVTFQAIGGTGALWLGAQLLAKMSGKPRIWISDPAWANHPGIFLASGFTVERYDYLNAVSGGVDFQAITSAAGKMQRGDAFLLQASCHNPSGEDLSIAQIRDLFDILRNRGVIPLIDIAYAGLALGFDADLEIINIALEKFDEVLFAFSCSKNFSLYRERVGLFLAKASSDAGADKVRGALASIARCSYSMPPDHGAAIVSAIVASDELRRLWLSELEQIRQEIVMKRQRLSSASFGNSVLSRLSAQTGFFSLLPLSPADCGRLTSEYGIYLPDSGRINVLGISDANEATFMRSLGEVLNG
nr:aromatic amino acid transaminase [uncultured Rhodopila sp.]